ncbi:ccch zinc finger and rrm domain-containing protein [Ophiostoma piceae UAMH 11346]|uniref:Ccch zinc finger and rrm domain-containing protein n=1 Tax=Ophiostoma piceae (strain UAMH 11346) TaxID=1262450 RepID=S3C012_OPHP1|nr:ccch zinc finger and rrm domain-containing protein [Ophiostoma piceae UAMH 11346]
MLFPERDAPVLKTWIVKRLETPTDSDVDADVLADYVLALLRHDGDASSVQKLCVTELDDFLKDGPFVKDVFQALSYKSYLPGARAPPPPQPAPKLSSSQSHPLPPNAGRQLTGAAPSFVPGYAAPGPPGVAPPFGRGASGRLPVPARDLNYGESRKRAYRDSTLYTAEADAPDASNFQPGPGGRAAKAARRGDSSRGGRGTGRGGLPAAYSASGSFGAPPPEEILRMQQQLGLSIPMYNRLNMPTPGKQPTSTRKKRRCRNLDQKGTCTKPNCQFDHGEFPGLGSPMSADAFMGMFPFFPPMPPFFDPQQHFLPATNRAGRSSKSQLSADGPVYDQSKSTIVVEGIPDEYLGKEAVEQFFSQFGHVESTEVKVPRKLAIVKFTSWEEANAAYQSPKVVFDNRFVKVYWLKDEAANGHANGAASGAEPELNMEEFQQKQEEAQRTYEEKLRRKQELDQQREELGERMKDLLAKQAKERQKLVKMMAMAAAKDKNRQRGGTADGEDVSGTNTPSKQAAITQTDLIRAQLAALEEEARMLGLDPDAILRGGETSDDTGAENSSAGYAPPTWQPRGGYAARGRGGFHRGGGRGSSYAGRGKNASVYAAYSLDNRPRRVAVAGVDFTAPDKDEALRQYLLGIGDFAAIETTADAATITFADRRTAEQFYYGLPRARPADDGKTSAQNPPRMLPGVSTPVEIRWVANTAGMAAATNTNTSMSASGHNGNTGRGPASGADSFTINTMDDDEDDNSSHGYPDREDGEIDEDDDDDDNRRQQLRDQNMDFDVAGDDGGWDIA